MSKVCENLLGLFNGNISFAGLCIRLGGNLKRNFVFNGSQYVGILRKISEKGQNLSFFDLVYIFGANET